MWNQIEEALAPPLALQEVLENWNQIYFDLGERSRKRAPQVNILSSYS